MRLVETIALVIRLLSIYFIFKSLSSLVEFLWMVNLLNKYSYNITHIHLYVVAFAIFIPAALVCFALPVKVTTWLLPNKLDQYSSLKGDLETIQLTAFIIVGASIFAFSLPDLVSDVILIYMRSTPDFSSLYDNDLGSLYGSYGQVFVDLIKISIGAYLLFGAPSLASLLKKFRTLNAQP